MFSILTGTLACELLNVFRTSIDVIYAISDTTLVGHTCMHGVLQSEASQRDARSGGFMDSRCDGGTQYCWEGGLVMGVDVGLSMH